MAARKKTQAVHAKTVMRQIRRLARPFPAVTAQARLDEIAELATSTVSTAPLRVSREEPAATSSADVRAEDPAPEA